MRRFWCMILLAGWLMAGCASPADATSTAVAQTQAFERDMSTALVGTLTASAPTATHTSPPPTATATRPPAPTPSGKFDFFDVKVEQMDPNDISVTFGYQIQKNVKLDGLMIGAWPEGCGLGNLSFRPFVPGEAPSGIVNSDNAVHVNVRNPGKCDSERIQVFVFRNNGGNLFQRSFDVAPFSLEMQ